MYIYGRYVSRKWMLLMGFLIIFLPACVCLHDVKEWYVADEVKGTWSTEVTIFEAVPAGQEVMFKSDCDRRDDCVVQVDTCVSKIVDDYVHDRTFDEELGRDLWDPRTNLSETYREDNGTSRSVVEVYIDRGDCVETYQSAGGGYTYLDCPVRKRTDVYRLVQQEKLSCTVDLFTYRPLETYPLQGIGPDIEWQDPFVPPGGKKESNFKGQITVISHANNIQFEDEFRKPEPYLRHFAEQPQYIGVDAQGIPVVAGSEDQLWIYEIKVE